MKNILLKNIKITLAFLLFLSILGGKYPISNIQAQTVPQEQKLGWSEWQQWDTFPHQQIQLGISNSDYGAMMDLESRCFGQVTSNNDAKKSEHYWYRISEQEKTSEYLKIEVACWEENNFKATVIINGLTINNQNNLGFGGPSSVENELRDDRITRERRSLFPSVDNSLQPWFNWKQEVNQDLGLNFGLDYNTVYQRLTASLNADEAAGGIFRFYGDWTLLGREKEYSGAIVFKVENRHTFSEVAPQNLGFQAGYSGITSTQFSDYGWGVTNLYWKQKFNQGRISFLIGKVDPTDYINVYGLINPLTGFQNLAFSTNPTIAVPNQGLGVWGNAFRFCLLT